MFEDSLPKYIVTAYYTLYASAIEVTEMKDIIEKFRETWGGFELEALLKALKWGKLDDRLLAMFALVYIVPANIETLLAPFLDSPLPKERWVSTLALGMALGNTDERLVSRLQDLLLEEMDYHGSSAQLHLPENTSEQDQQLLQHIWDDEAEYEWYMRRRYEIVWLLGDWRDLRALSTLHHVLQTCQELRQMHTLESRPYGVLCCWATYQNFLEGAVGMLEKIKAGIPFLSRIDREEGS